jgi:hypothetical protein
MADARGRIQYNSENLRRADVFWCKAFGTSRGFETIEFLFNAERASRLVEFHARDARNPGLEEVLDAVLNAPGNPHAILDILGKSRGS